MADCLAVIILNVEIVENSKSVVTDAIWEICCTILDTFLVVVYLFIKVPRPENSEVTF